MTNPVRSLGRFRSRRDLNPDEDLGKQLTLAFKDGDLSAYDDIYVEYVPRVKRICTRMLTKPEDAEEATQETFLRVYQALGRFNGRYQLGAWIGRIATNVCLDRLRSQTRHPTECREEDDLVAWADASSDGPIQPDSACLKKFEGREVWRTLDEMPPLHRAAIVLRDLEGLSYEEVATALSLSETQVKALIHRARKGFRKAWIAGAASAFLPTRLFQRMSQKWRSAQTTIEHGAQSAASSSPMLASCSAVLQQCGSLLSERAASVVTASVVGAAAIGGAGLAAGTGEPPAGPPPAIVSIERPAVDSTDRSTSKSKDAVRPASPAEGAAEQPAPSAEDEVPAEDQPVPDEGAVEEPAPSPSAEPNPEPSVEASPPGDSTPRGPAPAPQMSFITGQRLELESIQANEARVSCDPLDLSQRLDFTLSDGSDSFPAELVLTAGSGAGMELTVWKNGHEIRYAGGGAVTQWAANGETGRMVFRGRYGTGNPYAESAGLPKAGPFEGALTIDCTNFLVLEETLAFGVE